jgi:hypothetical protein
MEDLFKQPKSNKAPTAIKRAIKHMNEILPEEISLYQRASVKKREIKTLHKIDFSGIEKNHMFIGFGITGEIKGFVVCEANIMDFGSSSNSYKFVQGLFVESMNILLGKIMTEMEEYFDLMCYITPPKILSRNDSNSMLMQEIQNFKADSFILNALYDIDIDGRILPCNISFELKQDQITHEV